MRNPSSSQIVEKTEETVDGVTVYFVPQSDTSNSASPAHDSNANSNVSSPHPSSDKNLTSSSQDRNDTNSSYRVSNAAEQSTPSLSLQDRNLVQLRQLGTLNLIENFREMDENGNFSSGHVNQDVNELFGRIVCEALLTMEELESFQLRGVICEYLQSVLMHLLQRGD